MHARFRTISRICTALISKHLQCIKHIISRNDSYCHHAANKCVEVGIPSSGLRTFFRNSWRTERRRRVNYSQLFVCMSTPTLCTNLECRLDWDDIVRPPPPSASWAACAAVRCGARSPWCGLYACARTHTVYTQHAGWVAFGIVLSLS